jgi:hypothetical protein
LLKLLIIKARFIRSISYGEASTPKDLDKKPIRFEKPEQINQFLFEVAQKQGVIQTDDENLTIIADIRRSNEGGIILKLPKLLLRRIYFKDEGL